MKGSTSISHTYNPDGKSRLVFLILNLPKEVSGKYNLELEASNENYRTSKVLEINTNAREGFVNLLTGAVSGYNIEIEKESGLWIWIMLILVLLVLTSLGVWKIYKNE